jgi:manganese transport protein
MLYLAMGILGATVMPHNLYLHSAIVQTRAFRHYAAREARGAEIRHHRLDRGADVRAADQRLDPDPGGGELQQGRQYGRGGAGQASALLHPLLGSAIAPTLFGIALLCCGLNSTVTATLAGQAVMEGFLDIRLPPWLRRSLRAPSPSSPRPL